MSFPQPGPCEGLHCLRSDTARHCSNEGAVLEEHPVQDDIPEVALDFEFSFASLSFKCNDWEKMSETEGRCSV